MTDFEFHSVGLTINEVDAMSLPSFQLGCSPAEQQGSPERREFSWAEHDGTAELKLWEDGDV